MGQRSAWFRFLISLKLFGVFGQQAEASWNFRAREHYDQHRLEVAGESYRYTGLSNTINFWYEQPYSYSLGLAVGPLLGAAMREIGTDASSFGESIQLIHAGVEYKFFPSDLLSGLFFRLGGGGAYLRSRGQFEELNGSYAYGGLGWEFAFERLGVALEIAARQSQLGEGVIITTLTPSIGFHFYSP